MRLRTTLMVAVLIVASMGAGVAAGTPANAATSDSLAGSTTELRPDEAVNNTTDEKYRGVEPTGDYLDKPVLETDLSADASTSSGGTAASNSSSPEGMTRQFLTSGPDGYKLTTFELREVGDNVEVWVATDLSWGVAGDRATPSISEEQVEHIAQEFDQNIYPKESATFGKPKARDGSNGLVGPAGYYNTTKNAGNKTVLLVQNIRDKNYYNPDYPLYIAGYYSPTVQTYSDRNVITIDAYGWSNVTQEDPNVGYEGTLAHEYQHLIHGDLDPDETTWVNEGMSDYAEVITGYGVSESHLGAYEQMPSNSLINWEDQGAINVLADYGVAFVFQLYLADEYGQDFISDLAKNTDNGIASVESTLADYGADRDFYSLYQDFSTAVVTDKYGHPPKDRFTIDGVDLNVNTSNGVDSAGLYGADYRTIDTTEKGPIKAVSVTGTQYPATDWQGVTVDGQPALYSGSGNLLDRHAITSVDLSDTENPTLTFETKYTIEKQWDYGFVQVSTDGGETWQTLETQRMNDTPADGAHPTVKANAPGYSGSTNGEWVSQSIDLSEYAGQEVLVSFRYTTDWAVESPGWYVRNVSVAGNTVSTNGTDAWMSLRQVTGDRVEYQFSFVGVKHNGNYKVKQLDMRTFTDAERHELKQFLHNGNFEKVVVVSAWAGNSGESGRVPVGVDFTFQHDDKQTDASNKTGKHKDKQNGNDKQNGKDKQKHKNGSGKQ